MDLTWDLDWGRVKYSTSIFCIQVYTNEIYVSICAKGVCTYIYTHKRGRVCAPACVCIYWIAISTNYLLCRLNESFICWHDLLIRRNESFFVRMIILFVHWLIDWIEFYAMSAIYQPCNGVQTDSLIRPNKNLEYWFAIWNICDA